MRAAVASRAHFFSLLYRRRPAGQFLKLAGGTAGGTTGSTHKNQVSANMRIFSPLPRAVLAVAFIGLHFMANAQEDAPDPNAVPWGIASSASSFRTHAEWFPKLTAAGVPWARLFPEWRGVEPAQGMWKWDKLDAMMKSAADNNIQILAILMGSTPWTKDKSHVFPMNHLDAWSDYVSNTVERYKSQIHYWEVWNEGNGGFNDNHNSTADYASLVATTYSAARKADPNARVGMTVASFDAPYLNQAILALAKTGKPNSFDFLCIHPYEIVIVLRTANRRRLPGTALTMPFFHRRVNDSKRENRLIV